MLQHLTTIAIQWTQHLGYMGIFLGMLLESACVPLPSEIIMPLAGYLAYLGKMNCLIAALIGTFGNLVGSVVAYAVGYAARSTVLVGLKNTKHYRDAERWFETKGDKAVLISRMLPGIRTFISLPAGAARSRFGRFVLYTIIGSFPWCVALTLVGYMLGRNWERIHVILHPLGYAVVVLIGLWLMWKGIRVLRTRQRDEIMQ